MSRPRTIVLETLRPADPSKTGGRPRTKNLAPRTRVNWFHPVHWSIICEVMESPSNALDKSPSQIVKDLIRRSHLFNTLTPQVLGGYITGGRGERRLTPYALERAAAAAKYGPKASSRHGVLVRIYYGFHFRRPADVPTSNRLLIRH
jgi:hypothetical protein